MEFVDQSDEKLLGTSQGGLLGTSNFFGRIGSTSKGPRIISECSVPSDIEIDAIVLGKPELL